MKDGWLVSYKNADGLLSKSFSSEASARKFFKSVKIEGEGEYKHLKRYDPFRKDMQYVASEEVPRQ